MNSCRLRILHSLINKNYITITGNRRSIFKTNKWYSTTGNSSEINFESKQHESCSRLLSSENCGCAGAKEHQETPSSDPPLILSVRPYPKSKVKELSKQPFQTANDKPVTSIDSAPAKSQTYNGNCVKSSSQSTCDEIKDISEVPKHKDGDCPWSLKEIEKKYAVCGIIQSYQVRGYLAAKVDPLRIQEEIVDLEIRNYKPPQNVVSNLSEILETDLNCEFELPHYTFIGGKEKFLKLKDIITRLEKVYCHHIGLEFAYLSSTEQIQFLRKRFETPGASDLSNDLRKRILKRLTKAVVFELFVAKKWPKSKRLGLEGAESLVPGIKQVIDRASSSGVHTFIIGTAHRGRLNILTNVIHKQLRDIFIQFESSDNQYGSSDVMYQLGSTIERKIEGKKTTLTLMPHASNLETISPLVIGRTRSEQFFVGDNEGKQVMSIIIHGDAVFSARGAETINLSKVPNYTSRGTIHFIINDQTGFTTNFRIAYSSNLGQMTCTPIFRVNGDDPDALILCCNIAVDFRNKFQSDVIIEIVCYRRHGNSELDDPSINWPIMYKKIKDLPNVLKLYIKKLSEENAISEDDARNMCTEYLKSCDKACQESQKYHQVDLKAWLDKSWDCFFEIQDSNKIPCTGVKERTLKQIGMKVATPPPPNTQFDLHDSTAKILSNRIELLNERKVDWGLSEAMAFGSLVLEGYHVRLSGKDVERGIFGHQHRVYYDQSVDRKVYIPLKHLAEGQGDCTISNSSLCDCATLGFDLGYSMTNPNVLVIWEGQFEDILNTGQVIVDTYVSSSEIKWNRQLSIVLLFPHGLEGQGPDHSSARMERFLQMCNDDPDDMPCLKNHSSIVTQLRDVNWIVAVPSTPANYFHILRRQLKMPFRKPLILFTPKQILKTNHLISSLHEMTEGTSFQKVIAENGPAWKNPKSVKRLIFCTGKVYYDLVAGREERKLQKYIAITRIEQLCPFPYELVYEETLKYSNAEICWSQEEHKNSGPWSYIYPRFSTALQDSERDILIYVGRPPAAAPATGNSSMYDWEQKQLINDALNLSFPSSGGCLDTGRLWPKKC